MTYLILSVVSALRVHALSHQNWCLLVLTLVLGMESFVVHLYFSAHGVIYLPPVTIAKTISGCQLIEPFTQSTVVKVVIPTRLCVLMCNAIVVIVTYRGTYNGANRAISLERKPLLAELLLRDGILYFLLLGIMNIMDMFVYSMTGNGAVMDLALPLSTMLVSRLLLNIHEAAPSIWRLDSQGKLHATSLACCRSPSSAHVPSLAASYSIRDSAISELCALGSSRSPGEYL